MKTKKTLKMFSLILAIMLTSNAIFPVISLASNDITEVEVTLYEDEDRIITTTMPKNLAEDKIYLDYIISTQIKPMLKELENSPKECSLGLKKGTMQPFFVTPEQPKTPDRKLLGPCKVWTLADIERKIKSFDGGVTAWAQYFDTFTSTLAGAAFDKLMITLFKTAAIKSTIPMFFVGIFADGINKSKAWWAESLYLLTARKISKVRQCIYENLRGDYPKVFNIMERVK